MYKRCLITIFASILASVIANPLPKSSKFVTTADRISSNGYPVETHTVQTSDGYILTMFRIPYSPKLGNENVHTKPIVYLQHGLLTSTDCWILNGPYNSLAYMLADAGYDVWMGNTRGNTYSKKHAEKSPLLPPFWSFSWNEVGIFDLPALIDYVLYTTQQDALHYVGHSQGTTAFLVLLSSLPLYNNKIKTSHLLAPVGYMEHMQTPLSKIGGPLLGHPTLLSKLIGSNEFMPSNKLLSMLGSEACANNSSLQLICGNVLFLLAGWDSKHLNYTLLPEVAETHPAGASTSQVIHYLQERQSGYFRRYDFGKSKNKKTYQQKIPPEYFVENIRPEVPVEFYYGNNDYFASVADVERLAKRMGQNVRMYNIKYPEWNHLDFLWALEVKEVINDRIIKLVSEYERH